MPNAENYGCLSRRSESYCGAALAYHTLKLLDCHVDKNIFSILYFAEYFVSASTSSVF